MQWKINYYVDEGFPAAEVFVELHRPTENFWVDVKGNGTSKVLVYGDGTWLRGEIYGEETWDEVQRLAHVLLDKLHRAAELLSSAPDDEEGGEEE